MSTPGCGNYELPHPLGDSAHAPREPAVKKLTSTKQYAIIQSVTRKDGIINTVRVCPVTLKTKNIGI